MTSIGHWIAGRHASGTSGRTGTVYDPARGVAQAEVAFASAAEVDDVVKIAVDGAAAWADSPSGRRASLMFALRELIDQNRVELASAVTREHGKTLVDARGEVDRGLECVEFACGIPHLMKGSHSSQVSSGIDVHTLLQPVGVVAGITPFNFPVMVPLWMLSNALACGNAFVLKPSEKDPSASLILAELVQRAGFPDGVFNVVQGDSEAVDALLTHPDVKSVSFVGSTPIAQYVYETGTAHGKRVQALGGAKNHMLVLPDADLDLAADAAVNAGFGSAGERCMAISALVAVEPIADELIGKIKDRMGKLVTGDGTRGCDMGPLVTKQHRDKVASYLDSGVSDGATLVVDGRDADFDSDGEGYFLAPTLFDNVRPGMSVYDDEIFGPVLSVVRVHSYDEGLHLINRNPYGNGTAIFTNDGGAARKFQRQVEVGMVGVNVPIPVPVSYYSFGGWKHSLFGDTHAHGVEGVHFFTRGKVVTSRWLDPSHGGLNLGFPQND